jgi:hypothetical protein
VQGTVAARDTAFAKRDPELLARFAEAAVPEFDVKGRKARSGVPLRAQVAEQAAPQPKRWWEFWK